MKWLNSTFVRVLGEEDVGFGVVERGGMAKGGQGLLQVRVALLECVGSGLGLPLPGEHSLQVAGSHSGRWVVLRSCCQTTSQAKAGPSGAVQGGK